jgi:hypothetical protein
MRNVLFFSILFSVFLVFNQCSKTPVYPITPEIEYKSITKYGNGDSLKISVNFKDGDGDLGLSSEDTYSPYNLYDFVKDNNGNVIQYGQQSGMPPYNCVDYDTLHYNGSKTTDTLWVKRNPFYYNYWVDILIKQPDNSFQIFDLKQQLCMDFNSRFPRLSTDKGPLRGTLDFKIVMSYLLVDPTFYNDNFYNKTIKFRVTIADRALHKSNSIVTDEVLINF